jgi:flagellar biosynthesis protein FlhF
MIVRKFEAESMEGALKRVKAEMGPDALILSTENKKGGVFRKNSVEVTAAFVEKKKPEEESKKAFDEAALAKVFPHRRLEKALAGETVPAAANDTHEERSTPREPRKASYAAPRPVKNTDVTPQVRKLEKEWLEIGVNADTAAEFAGRLVLDYAKSDRDNADFLDKVKAKLLGGGIRTMGPETFDTRRCWAAIGTHGAGKTSLLVKLGMNLRNRRHTVQLVSCDRRKLVGRQELAAYAKLIKVQFATEIQGDRTGAKVQLIDTPSLTWDNKECVAEVEKICRDTNTVLVLDASARFPELVRTVERASQFAPMAIAFTRLDTIAQAGVIYEVLKHVRLPLLGASVGSGFAVPFQFFEPSELARWIVAKARA